MGENGLIKRAEQASQHQANAEASDNDAMGILDKYIEDASKVEKKPGLKISASTEALGSNARVVKLSYSIGTGEVTAEQIEVKLEELSNGEIIITDEIRAELEAEAKEIGISYEELLLELFVGGPLEEEARTELQEVASNEGMTYQEFLIYALEMEMGISFEQEILTIEELEEMIKEELGIEITDENRESIKTEATNAGMTYREYLEYALNLYGVDTSGVTTEVTIEDTNVGVVNSEFIATRNGTYTVRTIAKNGMQTETQIEVTGIEEEKFSSIYNATTTYTDANGATATIPAGFAVGTSSNVNTIANGLVITDAVDSDGYSIGNEFVWIPVESDETFIRESFTDTELDTTSYLEPNTNGYSDGNGTEEIAEYNEMRKQVLAYNGFYIGRYEAGVNSTVLRKEETEAQEVVVKRGVAPYNYTKWGNNSSDIGTSGTVYLSQNMYKNSESVTSTLCYGVQWDKMCRYIEDYTRTLESNILISLTGMSGEDVSKNIYDLAGNCWEWTMEMAESGERVWRGGSAQKSNPIYCRDLPSAGYDKVGRGFRLTLYISVPKN